MSNIPSSQVAIQVLSFGDPVEGLEVQHDRPVEEPREGQVLVKMHLAALNPSDVFTVKGQYPGVRAVLEKRTGFVPGLEGCGTVVRTGPSVSLSVGTRVAVFLEQTAGTWQSFVTTEESQCFPVPEEMEDFVAAQLFVNPLSCLGMLRLILDSSPVQENPWIVQTAANSTLGRMFIQMSKGFQLKTINIIRTSIEKDALLKLGADIVISLDEETDVMKKVKEITSGLGVAAALDAVGGDIGTLALQLLGKNGLFIGYGRMSGEPIRVVNRQLMYHGITIRGFWLSSFLQGKSKTELVHSVIDLWSQKCFAPSVEAIYTLDDFRTALKSQFTPNRKGKILFRLN
ncbi:hypothetical protein GpartN1_g3113.t1 [Galdieria partita]|uniref:Enoyl reductase (ER) domain-containing protein n=1 Tax=Galdieria partita TaxID=83374 RepID=A0A9C7PXI4_9RHOD|nr:hypothetical protein GpartN1_g3113.t1 [Galdieria partita]